MDSKGSAFVLRPGILQLKPSTAINTPTPSVTPGGVAKNERMIADDLEERANGARLVEPDLPPPVRGVPAAFPGAARLRRKSLAIDGALGGEASQNAGRRDDRRGRGDSFRP